MRNRDWSVKSRGGRAARAVRYALEVLEGRVLLAGALTIADTSMAEGNSGQSDMVFTLTRTGALTSALDIGYQTIDGTAVAGTDYVAKTGTAQFAPLWRRQPSPLRSTATRFMNTMSHFRSR